MALTQRSHWSLVYAAAATAVVVAATLTTSIMVGSAETNLLLIMTGLLWVVLFFGCYSALSSELPRLRGVDQLWLLFGAGVVARLAAVVLTYQEFQSWTGTPFEPYASDAVYYHNAALTLSEQITNGGLPGVLSHTTPSNLGYIVFVGLVYTVMGADVIAVRIVQAVIGAYTAVLLYKAVKLTVGEGVARSAGLLLALSPYLVYYTGLHLKETVLNFLIVLIVFFTVKVSAKRDALGMSTVWLIVALSTMFFFRTFLAVLLLLCVCGHVVIQRRARVAPRTRALVVGGVGLAMVVVVGIAQPKLWSEVVGMVSTTAGQWDRELRDKEQNMGTSIDSNLVSRGMFVAAAAVGPLPAVVSIPGQENSLIQYGFAWVRHSFFFFAIVGLYVAIRERFRNLAVVVLLLMGYIVIIGAAGLPTSHRFQLPTLPAWIIFAAIGLHVPWPRRRVFSAWLLSLVVIGSVVMSWNYLKLSVRGM